MGRYWFSAIVLSLGIGAAGCDSANGRFPVSGDVSLKGSPLPSGTILFESADGSQRGGTTISNGKYSLPAADGLLPGAYTVRVSAVESPMVDAAAPPGPEAVSIEKSNKDLVPPEFNTKSTLKFDAGPDEPDEFDIAIP